tara:strand:+ start:7463 stop:8500 length:1038 start_codon:yes stop_codon:yes gene_type:complete
MATNQEILESYRQGIGAGEGQVNTQMLIQALRDRQRRAEASDAAAAKSLQSFGKAGLNVIKARRDFLLAKRGNPDLKFTEFMADPKTSAKYMEQGTANIVSGESPKIGLKETLNPFSKDYARNLNVEKSNEMLQSLRRGVNQAIPSAEASMLPDQKLGDMPKFDDYSNLATPPPAPVPPPMGDITGEGLQKTLSAGQPNLFGTATGAGVNIPLPQSQYIPSDQIANFTKTNPQMINMGAGAIGKAPSQAPMLLRQSPADMGLQNIKSVPVPDPTAGASAVGEKAGAFGNVLGTANLGKNLFNVFKAKTDEDRKKSMTGAGISAIGLINPALGAGLSLINMLRNRR